MFNKKSIDSIAIGLIDYGELGYGSQREERWHAVLQGG
jgi:hypothetical protein